MSHFVSDAVEVAAAAFAVVAFAGGDLVFGAAFKPSDDNLILSIYSLDEAKIGVIAHDPTLLKVSCDNIICGCCTE